MRITKRQAELERLAWAGGFFDGEGSTFARNLRARPGYRQLNVAVSQRGYPAAPEVLTKFMMAMNGMGRITRPFNDLYQWRVVDDTQARAAVALLRPWIGTVKRRQADHAIQVVDEQYTSGRIRGRPGRRRPPILLPTVRRSGLAPDMRRRLNQAWAAGFLDGEGWFGLVRSHARVGGRPWYRIRASSTQHGEIGTPAAVLRRLHRVLGLGHIECHGEPDDFKWVAEGIPAIEHVLEIVGPWLGPVKYMQARAAMAAFTQQTRLKGDHKHCKRGHEYDRMGRRPNGSMHRRCNACARLLGRRARAAEGIAPRQFANAARRYTD